MPWGHFSSKVSTILCERAIEITVGCYMGHKCTITTRVVSNLLNNFAIFAVHTQITNVTLDLDIQRGGQPVGQACDT